MTNLIVTTSWDDGNILDRKVADLLAKYKVKGTFYVPQILYPESLENHHLLEIDRYCEIGAHTFHHKDLTKISPIESKREIEDSKIYLEEILGRKLQMFSYPDGKHNSTIRRIVRDAGFIAARTCESGFLGFPPDPYWWKITLQASNGSPLQTLRLAIAYHLPVPSLSDWEIRAKLLFDRALQTGGIYHIYGHALEFEDNQDWGKFERVLEYIHDRDSISYMTNGEIFTRQKNS